MLIVLAGLLRIMSASGKENSEETTKVNVETIEPENTTETPTEIPTEATTEEVTEPTKEEPKERIYYEIPEEYAKRGSFPAELQKYTYELCTRYDISYALVIAVIERESGYRCDALGDNGNSKGYMQIYEKWHRKRMDKLGCDNLLDPYQNILVGVDFLAELIGKYGTVEKALAAYNCGESGANKYLWSKGIYIYKYNKGIMERMKEIEEELQYEL